MCARDLDTRPLAYEEDEFLWNLQRVPDRLPDGSGHPARTCGIFVVHGMGKQGWTETAALFRSGFEIAMDDIRRWQCGNPDLLGDFEPVPNLPAPFVCDGYWANYENIEAYFPGDWARFNERERRFFGDLWRTRVVSGSSTAWWTMRKSLSLLRPGIAERLSSWVIYVPLQVVVASALAFGMLRYREPITEYFNDVRLYLDPRGDVERAIVQAIDRRVGAEFLRMLGLGWDFRELPEHRLIVAGGERLKFERVIWVAHSLGSVVSYNVIGALFSRATELEAGGDPEQKAGVKRFRASFARFVTMGSPLDKAAVVLGERAVTPWPPDQVWRMGTGPDPEEPEDETGWWVNFHHVLDPASGPLDEPLITSNNGKPKNMHARPWQLPGLAHVGYWRDRKALRYIIGRTYGRRYLLDEQYRRWPRTALGTWLLGFLGYTVWASLLLGAVWALFTWGPDIVRGALKSLLP